VLSDRLSDQHLTAHGPAAASDAEQPAPEAEVPAPEEDEVIEVVEAEVVEEPAAEPRTLEEAILEDDQPQEAPML